MTPAVASHIRGMEKAGRLAAETLKYLGQFATPGRTTLEIDKIAEDFIRSKGATPAPLNYHGFPRSICTSVNEVICHGVPDKTVLKEGDIVNIDVTVLLGGFHGDTSYTFYVGNVNDSAKAITEAAKGAMNVGIEAIQPGGTTGDIGFEVNKYVTKKGFHVVREIGGHGIGTKFHDDPFVPSYGKKGKGDPLRAWRCITVEPMVNETSAPMKEHAIPGSSILWYTTADKCLSAQFEHTVLITDTGYEIMTVCE
ncbi:MAG TPA: type I methionyl aminopeptidase [Bdellovibrionales bacterium]|nr:type I methionyl aminopeptidase [Bdellovibrionales bacterium]